MPPSRKSHLNSPLDWVVPVAIEDIPVDGKHFDLVAPETALAAIATAVDVVAVKWLKSDFDVSRRGDGLHIRGKISGQVEQACVVTLEPMLNDIVENVDLSFSPSSVLEDGSVAVSADLQSDVLEPMPDGTIDLAGLSVEFLMLGIDPYPRKAGATFATVVAGNDAEDPIPHPFAALEALKRRDGGSDR